MLPKGEPCCCLSHFRNRLYQRFLCDLMAKGAYLKNVNSWSLMTNVFLHVFWQFKLSSSSSNNHFLNLVRTIRIRRWIRSYVSSQWGNQGPKRFIQGFMWVDGNLLTSSRGLFTACGTASDTSVVKNWCEVFLGPSVLIRVSLSGKYNWKNLGGGRISEGTLGGM